ncbi:MAG: 16S rRNA (uracil(1498)-N(3))-methyltransferase [Microbacteriaceae bacterium]|nr:16S rRNA (uracil(1498)-N(3))-methyltransferase [Microbacteriaceae bacterium]
MTNLYYLDSSKQLENLNIGDQITLEGEDAHHAATVSRLQQGETIQIGDGNGTIYHCEAITVAPKKVVLEILMSSESTKSKPEIWLVQALAKGGRDELAIQMATELGVAGVIPWAASRSIVKWDAAKAEKNRERWQKILREAAKQSIRPHIPQVLGVITSPAVADLATKEQIIVLEPAAGVALSELEISGEKVFLVVGPEGGFTEGELDMFEKSGATLVRLGSEILRTSTAGAAAMSALNLKLGKW